MKHKDAKWLSFENSISASNTELYQTYNQYLQFMRTGSQWCPAAKKNASSIEVLEKKVRDLVNSFTVSAQAGDGQHAGNAYDFCIALQKTRQQYWTTLSYSTMGDQSQLGVNVYANTQARTIVAEIEELQKKKGPAMLGTARGRARRDSTSSTNSSDSESVIAGRVSTSGASTSKKPEGTTVDFSLSGVINGYLSDKINAAEPLSELQLATFIDEMQALKLQGQLDKVWHAVGTASSWGSADKTILEWLCHCLKELKEKHGSYYSQKYLPEGIIISYQKNLTRLLHSLLELDAHLTRKAWRMIFYGFFNHDRFNVRFQYWDESTHQVFALIIEKGQALGLINHKFLKDDKKDDKKEVAALQFMMEAFGLVMMEGFSPDQSGNYNRSVAVMLAHGAEVNMLELNLWLKYIPSWDESTSNLFQQILAAKEQANPEKAREERGAFLCSLIEEKKSSDQWASVMAVLWKFDTRIVHPQQRQRSVLSMYVTRNSQRYSYTFDYATFCLLADKAKEQGVLDFSPGDSGYTALKQSFSALSRIDDIQKARQLRNCCAYLIKLGADQHVQSEPTHCTPRFTTAMQILIHQLDKFLPVDSTVDQVGTVVRFSSGEEMDVAELTVACSSSEKDKFTARFEASLALKDISGVKKWLDNPLAFHYIVVSHKELIAALTGKNPFSKNVTAMLDILKLINDFIDRLNLEKINLIKLSYYTHYRESFKECLRGYVAFLSNMIAHGESERATISNISEALDLMVMITMKLCMGSATATTRSALEESISKGEGRYDRKPFSKPFSLILIRLISLGQVNTVKYMGEKLTCLRDFKHSTFNTRDTTDLFQSSFSYHPLAVAVIMYCKLEKIHADRFIKQKKGKEVVSVKLEIYPFNVEHVRVDQQALEGRLENYKAIMRVLLGKGAELVVARSNSSTQAIKHLKRSSLSSSDEVLYNQLLKIDATAGSANTSANARSAACTIL